MAIQVKTGGVPDHQMEDDNTIDKGAGKELSTGRDLRKETSKPQPDKDTSEKQYPNRHGKNQDKVSPDSKSFSR